MSTPEHHDRAHAAPGGRARSAEEVVADVDRRLRRYAGRADRRAITEDLLGDLRAAQAAGCDPATLIGPDVDEFARRTVEEGGCAKVAGDTRRVTALGALWSLPAVVLGYLVTPYAVSPVLEAAGSAGIDVPLVRAGVAWAGLGAVCALSVLAVMVVLLRGRAAARPTLQVAAFTVPFAAAVAVAVNTTVLAVGPITHGSIAVQVAGVVVPLVGALALARSWGLRRAGASSGALLPA
ncbi:hypothetical protein [Quadrisphaera sp. INWT6]|uniref:hypothetical protein n=1 Tax=Quadrisphaera sp. INWT6 TaxID=2596917 RepID=UPI0018928756|nr:hypothetical protein [Quadrisphaera sp. INWT6]MBF5082505.1 hypothetical protein [Quadrisphaera sp. INWT6]